MSKIIIRKVEEEDASTLRYLASICPPLDVHTHYTFWVLCRFFSDSCFIASEDGENIGYITAVDTKEGLFIWQIGILKEKRGNGLAYRLIEKVFDIAKKKGSRILVTIAEDNKRSFNTFKNYCERNSAVMKPIDELRINDIDDFDFLEKETVYSIEF